MSAVRPLPKILTAAQFRALQAGRIKTVSRARGRHIAGQMNKTEKAYADHLQMLKFAGEILEFEFEAHRFKLGENCYFTPDFYLISKSGDHIVDDTKGTGRNKENGKEIPRTEDDALVKLKMLAKQCWWLTVRRAYYSRDAACWVTTEVKG